MDDTYFLASGSSEWLLTNGIGGYALGTGNLINQRKYHGLLIGSDKRGNRHSLLSGLEILVEWRGETFHIDSTNYSNCIYPEGFLHLVKSWLRPYPAFLYSSLHHNNDILILIELKMAYRENTIKIDFQNLGRHQLHLHIRPKLTMRNHHYLNETNFGENHPHLINSVEDHRFSVRRNDLSLWGFCPEASVSEERIVFHDCYYPWEAIRGYQGVEDLISSVKIKIDLQVDSKNSLLFSDTKIGNIDKTVKSIDDRYRLLPLAVDYPSKNDKLTSEISLLESLDYDNNTLFNHQDYLKVLKLSLQDFLLEDDVIAGYPWFGCWGRDTFISLEAFIDLMDSQQFSINPDTIWSIFTKYAMLIEDGLLPNMLPESGQAGNYDSIDSSLWFVIRLEQYLSKLGSLANKKQLYEKRKGAALSMMHQILKGLLSHSSGKFHVDYNGFIVLSESFAASTWMDAKIDGEPITPRFGAPVEINALFYNALCIYRNLSEKGDKKDFRFDETISGLITLIEKNFSKFFMEHYLADRIVEGEQVHEIRPNALIAASLDNSLIPGELLKKTVQTAEEELLTPYGIRSLSKLDYRFKKKYLGNQDERDSQYHQGTVWTFLLDFYIKTYCRAFESVKDKKALKKEIEESISVFREKLQKGHFSSIAEVWDGHNPRVPKGCPAQAWSVAALWNIETLISQLEQR